MNNGGKVILFTNARDELKLKEWVSLDITISVGAQLFQ